MKFSYQRVVRDVNKIPSLFDIGDSYIESQVTFRQWLVGGCSQYESPAFWLLRGASEVQADDISQAFIALVRAILENKMPTPIGQIISLVTLLDDADWLPMDGQSRATASYPELTAIIPANWITGANFTLPAMDVRSLIGAVPIGSPQVPTYGIGKTGGTEQEGLSINQIPSHNHGATGGNLVRTTGSSSNGLSSASVVVPMAGIATTANTGGGLPHNNMPPFLTVYFYIRCR